MLKKLKCEDCWSELLLDVVDPHGCPEDSKATEVIFKKIVVWQDKGISREKNLDLKISCAVLELLGLNIFTDSTAHLFAHSVSVECDHLSSILKLVTQKYLSLRIKPYGKKFSQMVIHKNQPSLRHKLTKTILFRNQ